MFISHPNGAKAAATFFTLIETAKANGWEPHTYMVRLMNGLLHAEELSDFVALLPTKEPVRTRVKRLPMKEFFSGLGQGLGALGGGSEGSIG